jgi:TM2 domain-containing membrane protein YozV
MSQGPDYSARPDAVDSSQATPQPGAPLYDASPPPAASQPGTWASPEGAARPATPWASSQAAARTQPPPHAAMQQYAPPPPAQQAQAWGAPQAGVQPGYPYAPPQGQIVVPKNPVLGLVLSLLLPGLGSMVNGEVGKGCIILGLYALGWILSIILIGIPLLIGAWIWGLVDGYQSAQRWNQAHGIIA